MEIVMRLIIDTVEEQIPAGKRSVRENRWGNTNAYVSGRFWKTLGPTYAVGTDQAVEEFLNLTT
jgi:hypothetical protein